MEEKLILKTFISYFGINHFKLRFESFGYVFIASGTRFSGRKAAQLAIKSR